MAHKTNRRKRKLKKRGLTKKRRMLHGGNPNPPTLMSNLQDASNLMVSAGTNLIADGLQRVGQKIGVDPKKTPQQNIQEIGNNMSKVVSALKTPEGQRLKQEASELLAESLDVLEPSIKKGEQIITDGMKKLAETGTGIVATAFNELPPVFALTEASKFATAAAQAGETVAELTTTGAEAFDKLEGQKQKAQSLISDFQNVMNTGVSNVIQNAQNKVDDYGKNIADSSNAFKQIHKEALMVGGRLQKSKQAFLHL